MFLHLLNYFQFTYFVISRFFLHSKNFCIHHFKRKFFSITSLHINARAYVYYCLMLVNHFIVFILCFIFHSHSLLLFLYVACYRLIQFMCVVFFSYFTYEFFGFSYPQTCLYLCTNYSFFHYIYS